MIVYTYIGGESGVIDFTDSKPLSGYSVLFN